MPIDPRRLSLRVVAAQYNRLNVNHSKEFYLLTQRYLRLALRIPIGFVAVIMMALSNSFFIASIFGGVGSQKLKAPVNRFSIDFDRNDPEFTAHNIRVATNWVGVINFVAMDSFIGLSMAMVS